MRKHDRPDALHYVDPPYHPDTRCRSSAYRHDMKDGSQHASLLEFLGTLE